MSGGSKRFEGTYSRIYSVVSGIPRGCVATYGQVATLAGLPRHARQVGYALNALRDGHGVPWHRVINAKGKISVRSDSGHDELQRKLLEAEDVMFDSQQKISLEKYGWKSGAHWRQCVLFDWGDTVMRVFPEYSGPMADWPKTETIPGIVEAVSETRKYARVCLATNAADSDEPTIRKALERVGVEALFDRVFCFGVVGARKPSPEFYRQILKLLDLESGRVFMVGDDYETDVLGANAVGIRAIWLNRHSREVRNSDMHTTVSSLDALIGSLEMLGFNSEEPLSTELL